MTNPDGLQDPGRSSNNIHSSTTDRSGHQSSSVKRHETRRFSNSVAPYPRPSLLAAIRQKASTALQEALKWPHVQLSKWTTVKKPEKEAKEEESPPSGSSVLQIPTLTTSSAPSKHVAHPGAAEAVAAIATTLSPPAPSTSPSEHNMTFEAAEAGPVFQAIPFQPSLPSPSVGPQEHNIVEAAGEQICSLIGSTDQPVGSSPAHDSLSDGEIDESSVEIPKAKWTPSDQLNQEALEARVRDCTPAPRESQRQPPRGPRQQRPFHQKPLRGPGRQLSSRQPQGPCYQPLTIRTESVALPPSHPLPARKDLCYIYTSTGGKCPNGGKCQYLHDPTKLALCLCLVHGARCSLPQNCPLSHEATSKNTPTCTNFLRGTCTRADCVHVHPIWPMSPNTDLCLRFVYGGYCEMGETCCYLHLRQCSIYATLGHCPNLWCQFAHVGYQSKQVPVPLVPAREDWPASTLVSSTADEEHDRMNPFNPRSTDEQAAMVDPNHDDQDADAAHSETIDDEMEAVSDAGSFSLQDDYIAL